MKHHYQEQCRELLSSISDYVDGSLQQDLCRELERHLAECEDCRVVLNTFRKTVELYHSQGRSEMPSGVRERLFKRLSLDDLARPRE
ncbi:MAG: anti-sigma factor family protein [Bacteroidota bacterium]